MTPRPKAQVLLHWHSHSLCAPLSSCMLPKQGMHVATVLQDVLAIVSDSFHLTCGQPHAVTCRIQVTT